MTANPGIRPDLTFKVSTRLRHSSRILREIATPSMILAATGDSWSIFVVDVSWIAADLGKSRDRPHDEDRINWRPRPCPVARLRQGRRGSHSFSPGAGRRSVQRGSP